MLDNFSMISTPKGAFLCSWHTQSQSLPSFKHSLIAYSWPPVRRHFEVHSCPRICRMDVRVGREKFNNAVEDTD